MSRFLILPLEAPGSFDSLSPAEMQGILERYVAWTDRLQASGSLVSGEKLKDGEGRVLRQRGDELVVLDGPYTETKELIGGFWIVEAGDYDAAVGLARDCPHLEFGTLEIRQIDEL